MSMLLVLALWQLRQVKAPSLCPMNAGPDPDPDPAPARASRSTDGALHVADAEAMAHGRR